MCNNNLCGKTVDISTEKEGGHLNSLTVLGALGTGSGFVQEQEKFATMNMAYMSQPTFSKYERLLTPILSEATNEKLREAIREEITLAFERGDVDANGLPCITVIEDGGWCKGTYGHGYNAASGIVSISIHLL